jgi:hypothetical protein
MNTIQFSEIEQAERNTRVSTVKAEMNGELIATYKNRIISNNILKCHAIEIAPYITTELNTREKLRDAMMEAAKQAGYQKLSVCITADSAMNNSMDNNYLSDEFEANGHAYNLYLIPIN